MDVGVAIFFVLSGFLLFRPFVARQLADKPPVNTRAPSCGAASLRVLPGYWFALTFCVVLLGQLLGSVKDAFLYYSLLFPFASQDVALGGGPGQEGDYAIPQAWSLTAEFVFYLMLPVIAILLVRLGGEARRRSLQVRYALLICLALYLVGQLFRLYFLLAHAVVGAGRRDLGAQLGRLLRHRDGDGHLQRRAPRRAAVAVACCASSATTRGCRGAPPRASVG